MNNKTANAWQSFNESRTDFWVSVLFLLLESIIPGIAIWLTIGNDFSFSLLENLPSPIAGYVALICISYLLYTGIITTALYFLKAHKSDQFTYAFSFSIILIGLILLSYVFENTTLFIIIKFIILLLIAIMALTIGVFITLIARNQELKRKQNLEQQYQAWKKGEHIPTNKEIKFQRYEQFLLKEAQKQEEIQAFKKQLELKIDQEYQEQKANDALKIVKINEKLDKKEARQRAKQKKRDTQF
ncbi:DxFTY motif-containing membrane protein [Spiroplasma culicicola]|uniref:Transmembrane protein n=1 Tax=Spiroplasma culicicola AES-1 TaxID=1276246 RepID=W6A7R9_9MOLU|nr:hypothetical protein [Spiroplasma culicicola]AHI53032.1 hypothetical protein SCULI_v1c06910 [Spiroplasma culicicola AES-1]